MHRSFSFPLILATIVLLTHIQTAAADASIDLHNNTLTISDGALSAQWRLNNHHLQPTTLTDDTNVPCDLSTTATFKLDLADAQSIDSSNLHLTTDPTIQRLQPNPSARTLAERYAGWQATATFTDDQSNLQAIWTLVARDNANYFRQTLTLTATRQPIALQRITLIDWPLPHPQIIGSVPGSVLISGNLYCGIEAPSSECAIINGRAQCSLPRTVPLSPGQSLSISAVVGVARAGQLRRDFQTYLNRERPRPYEPFLNYNTWYDIGYTNAFNQDAALRVIHAFGQNLIHDRNVRMNCFVMDDGWDKHNSLWDFNSGFPNGFIPLAAAAGQYHAGLGVWLSPWGGYAQAKRDRIAFGQQAGYETNKGGFILSAPRYYQRFRQVCLDMIHNDDVNQFKFDGTGNANTRYPNSPFGSDFDAAISLIQDLRAARPDLFINLTTGTWPSPFWTRYADSIWRGGDDHQFAGQGTWRQRWITYRDARTYHNIVLKSPLYPLNSLMLHGIIYAIHAQHLDTDPAHDFADEVHEFFATGTQMQEMYITPALLSEADWNVLAESANWSRRNADVLVDTHWIGGDPLQGQIYGFAAWANGKGMLTLRNPAAAPASIDLDPAKIFELPKNVTSPFHARSPWQTDRNQPAVELQPGQRHHFNLAPWQVLTLEAIQS